MMHHRCLRAESKARKLIQLFYKYVESKDYQKFRNKIDENSLFEIIYYFYYAKTNFLYYIHGLYRKLKLVLQAKPKRKNYQKQATGTN